MHPIPPIAGAAAATATVTAPLPASPLIETVKAKLIRDINSSGKHIWMLSAPLIPGENDMFTAKAVFSDTRVRPGCKLVTTDGNTHPSCYNAPSALTPLQGSASVEHCPYNYCALIGHENKPPQSSNHPDGNCDLIILNNCFARSRDPHHSENTRCGILQVRDAVALMLVKLLGMLKDHQHGTMTGSKIVIINQEDAPFLGPSLYFINQFRADVLRGFSVEVTRTKDESGTLIYATISKT